MRLLPPLLFILVFFFSSTTIYAQEDWVIDNFQSNINILEDGKISVTENIDVDFGSLEKHGIYRDIPYVYTQEGGKKFYTEVEISTVSSNGSSTPFEKSKTGGYIRLKIGDPDKTLSGKNAYIITYQVAGILRSFEEYDELFWNVIGSSWPVPVKQASVIINLPSGKISQITCFEGVKGSKKTCLSNLVNDTSASFKTRGGLGVEEDLTVVVGYTKGLVPIIKIEPPRTVFSDILTLPSIASFLITLIISGGAAFMLWWWQGRDYWFRKRFLGDPQAKHEVKPIGAHEPIVVEYSPPENLRPAEVGTLVDERADTLDVTATIVDLAQRGFLGIEEVERKWAFGSKDYVLTKQSKDSRELLEYEKELYKRIFDTKESVKISDLKTEFYKDLKVVKEKLYEEMLNKKFFYENPESVRLKYILIGVGAVFFGGVVLAIGFMTTLSLIFAIGLGISIGSSLLILVSMVMPRKTAHGQELARRVKGYKLFIDTAEKYRQRFFEKKNMFNEILPYAIVFGSTEKFAKAFEKMGIEPPQPSWYTGSGTFNAAVFGASMSSFSGSMGTAMASAPGGSGFSGGGAGGGFGGGGGGSW